MNKIVKLAIIAIIISVSISMLSTSLFSEGIPTPQKTISKVMQFDRDPKIRTWLLRVAEGVCECCRSEAPFNQPDGAAYLEIHHLRQLTDGGSDTITAIIGLVGLCVDNQSVRLSGY